MRVPVKLLMVVGVALLLLGSAACSEDEDDSALWQIHPGDTVFIDGTDDEGEATVEQKRDETWIIDLNSHYRNSEGGEFKVEVRRERDGFIIVNMNGVPAGRDHDDCLSAGDDAYEHIARMEARNYEFEDEEDNPDTSNDDCVPASESDSAE